MIDDRKLYHSSAYVLGISNESQLIVNLQFVKYGTGIAAEVNSLPSHYPRHPMLSYLRVPRWPMSYADIIAISVTCAFSSRILCHLSLCTLNPSLATSSSPVAKFSWWTPSSQRLMRIAMMQRLRIIPPISNPVRTAFEFSVAETKEVAFGGVRGAEVVFILARNDVVEAVDIVGSALLFKVNSSIVMRTGRASFRFI